MLVPIAGTLPPIARKPSKADGFIEVVRQEALLKTGALQNAIFNSANFSSIATDAKGVIQIFNVGAERMLGYVAAEVVNQITPAEISDPQELIARAESLSLELATHIAPGFDALVFKASRGIEDIYELTYIRKNGSRLPAMVSVTALRDEQNTIIGYLLIGTDNTARKQADDKLRTASQYARSLIEASLDPLVTISPEGKITDVNAGSVKVTGVPREQLIGTDFSNYFTEPDKAREGYQQVFANGFVTDYPLTIRHANGRLTDVLYNASVYRDVLGDVLGVFAAARDITARKQAEAALLKAGALQNAIFHSANFSSIATDAKGVIQIFNVGAERMLGYSAAEVMNQITPADISDPRELVARAKALTAELGTEITPGFAALVFKASRGIEDIYELTYIRKDGSRLPAMVSVTALRDAQNAIIGYLLIGTDNTARKRVEQERARLDQALLDKNVELENARFVAEKANLAKSDFLSSMSHELRTPLGAILGFAQLIESDVPSPTAAQKRSIDEILKAGWYLLELINEILDLALIESGKLSLSEEPVSLAEVMRECETMIEPQAKQRGIHVTFTPLERPRFVHADRTRVKQVLINLLSNAIKYNRVGGTVTVDCTAGNAPNSLRISVHDTGAGLAAEQLAQLFQPFNRLGQKSNTEEGTGIWLVVCKRLVELMRGVIGVESTVGQGSVFWAELGLAPAPAAEMVADTWQTTPLAQTGTQNDGPQHTLLYVEDNPANLMLIEDLIARRPDIHLLSARDGIRGIELARTALPDLILMDINLPDISGLQALRILAKDRATSHIPVIALSANAVPSDIEKGLEAGFFRYLTKPIKVVEFMKTLDVALKFSAQQPSRPANQEPLS
jgi:PAS domain S-box-containing protein